MSRTAAEKCEIVWRWFRDNIFDRGACRPYLPHPLPLPMASLSPPSSSSTNTGLRVFSFNTWGLPIAPRCSERLERLSLLFACYDVCCLQEVSHNRDVHRVIQLAASHGLAYAHQFRQGVGFPVWCGITAPGLLVLSRFPIVDVALKRFPVNGLLQRFDHSDWVAGKGVGLVRVDVSALHPARGAGSPAVVVDVFLTHLHANYSNFYFHYARCYSAVSSLPVPTPFNCPDVYLPHRVAQAYELARFFSTHRQPHHLAVVCGDLNAPPYDIVLHLIQALTGLSDAYAERGGCGPGYTCGAFDNTFSKYAEAVARGEDEAAVRLRHSEADRGGDGRAARRWDERLLQETPKRIDYCLFALPRGPSPAVTPPLPYLPPSAPWSSSSAPSFALTECRIVKPTMDVDGKRYSLSDHHGVSATFVLQPPALSKATNGSASPLRGSERLAPGARLSLDLSPPLSPSTSTRSSSAAEASTGAATVGPTSPHSSPSLSTLLTVAIAIVGAGLQETQARRQQHWLAAARAALLFLFLTFTTVLHAEGAFAHSLHLTLSRILHTVMSARRDAGVEWTVWLVLMLGGLVRGVAGLAAVLVFLIAQFPSKEEEIALMETLQEMRIHKAFIERDEALKGVTTSPD